ncbi:hypothetical protein H0I76_07070 [Limibaculum sp. M0105]|uniref:Uncharacterized protein n=1 Tax=Thermohalobaculum xanthum TaxID=2753746 RepID=A0A8J7SGB5_9RHOB|nr:hypothetical protein [Thermohalobaculum xanthum]MBK0398945.1 hypothetical protein [Thermohalobaculum xanthum]
MIDYTTDLKARVPSADEIARIVARSRKLREQAIREMARALWARISKRHGARQMPTGGARHA